MQLNDEQKVPAKSEDADADKDTGRVEAFSDGVFAVAITLLILNIHGPDSNPPPIDSELLKYLGSEWATFLAFITSFATIGIMWINHHRLFTHIKRVDTKLLVFNLLLLLVIVFIPFPTVLLAQYAPYPQYHYAALLYSATNVLLAVCFNLVWRYASRENRLLDRRSDPRQVQAITDQYRFGPLFYVATFVLAIIYVPASIVGNLLLALFFAFPGRQSGSAPSREPDAR
ncbi:MAG: TMEM175 family protein [Chloroflexota bacterium]|nr:TMEM175 family protein [Chloroflexota bacterium]